MLQINVVKGSVVLDIKLKPLNLENDADCKLVVKWDNDPEIVNYIYPRKDKSDSYPFKTAKALWDHLSKKSLFKKLHFMAYHKNTPIGMCGIIMDPDFLLKKVKNTAWLGINIGEKSYWGKGIGPKCIRELEKICKDKNCQRVEIGTFGFNHRAIRMFKELGYKEIGRVEKFTFYNEKMWDDIRFEKSLV